MDQADIQSSLAKKGFVCEDDRDHKYYHHKLDGRYTGVKTKFSRGSNFKRLDPSLLSRIKKQLRLNTSREFRELVECPMSKDDYVQILRTKGVLG